MHIDMQQKQRVVAELRQEQSMTHQQIQALELLSVPVLELEAMVNSELESNPVLDSDGGQ
jgi:DNA-directed RNA polymerase specialized sigma54-like protein